MTTRIEKADRICGNTYRFFLGPDATASQVATFFEDKLKGVDIKRTPDYVDVGPLSMEEAGILVQDVNGMRLPVGWR